MVRFADNIQKDKGVDIIAGGSNTDSTVPATLRTAYYSHSLVVRMGESHVALRALARATHEDLIRAQMDSHCPLHVGLVDSLWGACG